MPRDIDRIRLENLRRLTAEAGSASELARRADVSVSYLSHIRVGRPYPSGNPRRMGDRLAARLERAMGKPHAWMDRPHAPADASAEARPAGTGFPLISWVQAGAWTAAPAHPSAEARLPCPVDCGPDTFVLRVSGESMAPRFEDGEFIFVDPDPPPEHGSYVVVRRGDGNGAATFKQLIEEDGRRYLKALNPDWPDRIVEADEHAVVCGTVVFKGCPV